MPYTYSPLLVLTSVLIAIIGAYACFDLVIRVQRSRGTQRRQWLVLASLAIGGSIWSMHFIAMIAIQLHQEMRYDGLLTLVSGLVAILMTAVALAIVSTERVSWQQIFLGGLVMGTGIVSMHYVGMFGMRGNFSITHDPIWTAISIIIGIVASTLSLWLVMGLQLRGVLRRLTSAIVMGLSIAGVHYSSMYGTSFEPLADNVAFSRPSLDPVNLGMVVALVTFALLGWTLLTLLPDTPATPLKQNYSRSENHAVEPPRTATAPPHVPNNDLSATLQQQSRPAAPQSQKETKTTVERIPVQRNKQTHFVAVNEIASISADGHYCTIRTANAEQHFCNIGFNKLLDSITLATLVRVHRSHAVNLEYVLGFRREHDKGVLSVGDDAHEIIVSRANVPNVRDALGMSKA